jgi:hypothetical protein
VAQQFARRYLPQDADAFEAPQLASLRAQVNEGLHQNNFFLRLYLGIRSELSGTTFPGIQGNALSIAIADSIRRNDFREYARQTIGEMLTNASSPLALLGDHAEQILQEVDKTIEDFE